VASARVFEHNNFGGRNVLLDNPGHQRYLLATFDFLNGLGFNDLISSVQLRSSTATIPSMCLLFEHPRFEGRLKAFAYNANRDVASLPDFNDTTSSVLLMDHNPTPTRSVFALRQLAGERLNQAIDSQLSRISDASRNGDVLLKFTIDLFEVSRFGDDLMLIEIPVRLHTPWPFSDYDAKLRYWIKFFLDSSHRAKAFVAAWGYWIEGGVLTGSIEGRLRPQVEANIGTVETQINTMLRELDFHRWTDIYLMPAQARVDADYDGNVADDCSLVLPYQE
jgi:hypothetical protein